MTVDLRASIPTFDPDRVALAFIEALRPLEALRRLAFCMALVGLCAWLERAAHLRSANTVFP